MSEFTTNSDKCFTPVIECEHCQKMAQMEIVATYSQISEQCIEGEYNTIINYKAGYIYDLLICPSCSRVMLQRCYYNENWDNPEMGSSGCTDVVVLYPPKNEIPEGLPDKIYKAYNTALKIRNIDANSYGVSIGRVIELACIDKKATGRYLGNKVDDLAQKGEIPSKLADIAKKLTFFRNVGAHPEIGELTIAEIPILDDLCKAILEYLYTAPYLAKQAADRIEKLEQKSKNKNPQSL